MQNTYWDVVNQASVLVAGYVKENRAQESRKLPLIIVQVYSFTQSMKDKKFNMGI